MPIWYFNFQDCFWFHRNVPVRRWEHFMLDGKNSFYQGDAAVRNSHLDAQTWGETPGFSVSSVKELNANNVIRIHTDTPKWVTWFLSPESFKVVQTCWWSFFIQTWIREKDVKKNTKRQKKNGKTGHAWCMLVLMTFTGIFAEARNGGPICRELAALDFSLKTSLNDSNSGWFWGRNFQTWQETCLFPNKNTFFWGCCRMFLLRVHHFDAYKNCRCWPRHLHRITSQRHLKMPLGTSQRHLKMPLGTPAEWSIMVQRWASLIHLISHRIQVWYI